MDNLRSTRRGRLARSETKGLQATNKSPTRKSPSRKIQPPKSPNKKKKSVSPVVTRKTKKIDISPTTRTTRSEVSTTTTEITIKTLTDNQSKIEIPRDRIQLMTPKIMLSKMSMDSTDFVKHDYNKMLQTEDAGDVEVAKITSFIVKDMTPEQSQHSNLTPTLTDRSESRRTVSRQSQSMFDEQSEYSDNEISCENFENELCRPISYERRSTSRPTQNLYEFGGQFGAAILMILIPLFTFALQNSCSNKTCIFKIPTIEELKSLQTNFNLEVGLLFIGFTWGISLLSIIPLGRVVTIYGDKGYSEYIFNGLSSSILTVMSICIAEYLNYPVIELIYKNYLQILIISILYGFIISFWCFIKSSYTPTFHWNPYGKSGKFLIDFFLGREINPKWFQTIEIKLVHYRISLILTLVFNGIFLYKNIKFTPITDNNLTNLEIIINLYENMKYDPAALLASSLTLIYIMDLLLNEHHLTSSFELQNEGVGAMLLLRYSIYPFMNSILSKYALDNPIKNVPSWAISLIIVGYIGGILLKRASNKLKYEFRLNPMNPKLAYLDTVPTFQGKRLLVASWWSSVRHPNYTGDLITNVSILSLLIWGFALPPLLAILSTILLLVHRASRVNERNSNRYNSAWTRYCIRVPNKLLPNLY